MSYFNIRLHESEQQAQRLLEYAQNMGQYITILKEIINDLQEGGEGFLDTRTILYNIIEEVNIERDQLTHLGEGLVWIVKRYEISEKLLALPLKQNPVDKFQFYKKFGPDYISEMPVKIKTTYNNRGSNW